MIDSSNGSIKDEAKTALKKLIDLHKLTVELVVHTNAVGSKDTQTKKISYESFRLQLRIVFYHNYL